MGKHPLSIRPLWWLGQALLVVIGGLFLAFGVQLLIAAYRLPDPFTFIMTFFAASLIILISTALVVGFLLRLRAVYHYLKMPHKRDGDAVQETGGVTAETDQKPAESPER